MYEHLRALREDKDLSQKQLADLLQVHQTTYSDYERGNVNIPVPALIKLADFYKTSIDYLVDHTQDPAIKENNLRRASPAAVTSRRNPAAERRSNNALP